MKWEDLHDAIDAHVDSLGHLAEPLRLAVQHYEDAAHTAREAEAAAALDAESKLTAQRIVETETALSLLSPDWIAAFPQLPDLVRQALAGWNVFNTGRDLTVTFEASPALSPLRIAIPRDWTKDGYCFTSARLQYAGFSQKYLDHNSPHGQPEYESFFDVKSLADALFFALRARRFLAEWTAAHAAWQEDEDLRLAAVEADRQRQEALATASRLERQATADEQTVETERMLAWVRSDPAVANLVRTFIAIENDRQSWDERVNSADEAASNAWSHFEQKSAELRRQADEARREADRQRDEARRYEDEAEEARKKMKDAERRSESYYHRRNYDY